MFHQNTNQSFFQSGREIALRQRFKFFHQSFHFIIRIRHAFPPSAAAVRTHKKETNLHSSGRSRRTVSEKREPRLADSLYMPSLYSFLQKHFQIVPITGSTVAGSLLPLLVRRAVLMEEVPGIQITDDDKLRSALPETVTPREINSMPCISGHDGFQQRNGQSVQGNGHLWHIKEKSSFIRSIDAQIADRTVCNAFDTADITDGDFLFPL